MFRLIEISIDIIFFSISWKNYFDRSILVISMKVLELRYISYYRIFDKFLSVMPRLLKYRILIIVTFSTILRQNRDLPVVSGGGNRILWRKTLPKPKSLENLDGRVV